MIPKPFKIISFKRNFITLLFCFFFYSFSFAQGNLLITPKRIVFDGTKRSDELNLANTGKDTATYDISFIQLRMKEDGTVENISEPDSGQFFADKYLRFFPRTVTLAPNEAQTVKVQIRKTEDMPAGEYRSHLYFRAVNNKPLGEKETKKDSGISVKLIPIFGISIPVIIRLGEFDTKLTLTDLSLIETDNAPALKITFNRSGNMSVYGDVMVDHITADGKITHVGIVKGFAVYTPNKLRHFTVPLNKALGVNYHSGKLRVTFTDQTLKENKLAEESISLN